VSSPPYFLSCGTPPIALNCEIRLSRPIVVRPSITQCGPTTAAGADPDLSADDAVGADLDVAGQLGTGLDDRRRVDARHERPTRPTAPRTSAPPRRQVSPSTLARAWNLKMFDFMRSSVTSRIIWSPGLDRGA
jgi:hypothetical protein